MIYSYSTATKSIAETGIQSLECNSQVIQFLAVEIIEANCMCDIESYTRYEITARVI